MEIVFNEKKPDQFAFLNDNIFFYKVPCKGKHVVNEYNCGLNNIKPFNTISLNSPARCMDWRPCDSDRDIVALGMVDGRIEVKNVYEELGVSNTTIRSSIGKDFSQKHSKQCVSIKWNKDITNWLASGYEKPERSNRMPPSLVVWDVNFCETSFDSQKYQHNSSRSSDVVNGWCAVANKPLFELASDSVHSLTWFQKHTLIAGFSRKGLKIYDVREGEKPANTTIAHHATFGICTDPVGESRIASHHDGTIVVWDCRNFTQPFVTIVTSGNIKKLQWSPDTCGQLLVYRSTPDIMYTDKDELLPVESNPSLQVYDVTTQMKYNMGEPTTSPCNLFKKTVRTEHLYEDPNEVTKALSWFPNHPHTILLSSNKGTFKVASVPDRALASSQSGSRIGVFSRNYVKTYTCNLDPSVACYSNVMKKRAKTNYGLLTENLMKNIELSLEESNTPTRLLWRWLDAVHRATSDTSSSTPVNPSTNPAAVATMSSYNLNTMHKSRSQLFNNKHHHRSSSHLQQSPSTGTIPPNTTSQKTYLCGMFQMLINYSGDDGFAVLHEWEGLKSSCDVVHYNSTRKLILQMCGWLPIANDTTNINSTVNTSSREHHSSTRGGGGNGGDTPNNLLNITTSVTSPAGEKMNSQIVHDYVKTCDEVEVSIERLCTLAIWSFDLTFAIKLLRDHMMTTDKENSSNWSTVAMALSGFAGRNSSDLWRETCKLCELSHPYLKRAFWFLVVSSRNDQTADFPNPLAKYKELLFDQELLLPDRIAFAALHLPHQYLVTYLKKLEMEAKKSRSLEYLMVTGLHSDVSMSILESHLDKTLDYQTVLGIILLSYNSQWIRSGKTLYWKDRYCELLNSWKYYYERINFEKKWNERCNELKQTQQKKIQALPTSCGTAVVHCNFCSKSITMKEKSSHYLMRETATPGSMITRCPHCYSSLPRCCVCSLSVGTRPEDTELKNWLSVCLKCTHGGHYEHVYEWFK